MADFKVKFFKRVMLLEKQPSGYIFVLEDGQDPAHIWSIWGGADTDGYQLTDWGVPKSTFDVREYEDGFSSTALMSGLTNACTVTQLTLGEMTYAATLDINSILIGVTPVSIDAGITQTSTGGGAGTFSVPVETYKAYARQLGWNLSTSASLSVVCVDPMCAINFGSYAMIANYAEVTMTPNTIPTEVDITIKRVGSRVRWGDAGSALCQVIIAEDDATNSAGYQDMVETVGQITALIPFDDRVVVVKNHSIYEMLYSGYPRIFDTSIVVPDTGSVCPKGVKRTGSKSCFIPGDDTFYLYESGGTLTDIGKNIAERFYGYNAEYSIEDFQKMVVHVFDDRKELWMWMPEKLGVANSEVYKYKDGAWTMTDYHNYGHGHLGYIGKDFYTSSSNAKGWVPIVFFDEVNLQTADSTDYPGTQLVTLNSYRDLQDGVSANSAEFETKDFPLELGSRTSQLKIQVKNLTTPYGTFVVYHSTDEGRTWSSGTSIKTRVTPDLEWYSYTFDVTSESIRFKFLTLDDIAFGKAVLTLSTRRREAIE